MPNFNNELIFLQSENARAKLKDVSAILKKSPQRLKYSLKQLYKEEVLHHPHCVFDYSYLGLILFKVYFKGGYIGEKDKAEILGRLSENPYIVSIYELSGEFDLVIELETPNPSRFNKEIKRLVNAIPTFKHYKIVLNVVTHIYPRAYLVRKDSSFYSHVPEIVVGGDRSLADFSRNEMAVMKNALENPLIRLSALARKSGMNVKTLASVLRNLQERKVIKEFKYVLNTNRLGIHKFRLFLELRGISPESEQLMRDYMKDTREIVQVNRIVGDWDLEVDIESVDKTRARYIINEIREKFNAMIETFSIIEFYQYYKKAYLPLFIFQENA